MASASIGGKLWPANIVQTAMIKTQGTFGILYGDTQLRLVRLPEGTEELTEGLEMTVAQANEQTPARLLPALGYDTNVMRKLKRTEGDTNSELRRKYDPSELRRMLAECKHFIVPLRKRAGADTLFSDRISVGRARNKDIVLRHPTVSKFHGWFQVDDEGRFFFSDAGSMNNTRVSGKSLPPREPTRVNPGDRMKFGTVDAFVCSAEMLWSAMHI